MMYYDHLTFEAIKDKSELYKVVSKECKNVEVLDVTNYAEINVVKMKLNHESELGNMRFKDILYSGRNDVKADQLLRKMPSFDKLEYILTSHNGDIKIELTDTSKEIIAREINHDIVKSVKDVERVYRPDDISQEYSLKMDNIFFNQRDDIAECVRNEVYKRMKTDSIGTLSYQLPNGDRVTVPMIGNLHHYKNDNSEIRTTMSVTLVNKNDIETKSLMSLLHSQEANPNLNIELDKKLISDNKKMYDIYMKTLSKKEMYSVTKYKDYTLEQITALELVYDLKMIEEHAILEIDGKGITSTLRIKQNQLGLDYPKSPVSYNEYFKHAKPYAEKIIEYVGGISPEDDFKDWGGSIEKFISSMVYTQVSGEMIDALIRDEVNKHNVGEILKRPNQLVEGERYDVSFKSYNNDMSYVHNMSEIAQIPFIDMGTKVGYESLSKADTEFVKELATEGGAMFHISNIRQGESINVKDIKPLIEKLEKKYQLEKMREQLEQNKAISERAKMRRQKMARSR